MNEPLIDIQQITYTYPVGAAFMTPTFIAPSHKSTSSLEAAQTKPALRNVTLQIQQGEYVVLLGHNGSGKSTLARHCNALLIPDEGNAVIAGLNTRDKGQQRAIRDMVGMIFQNPDNQIIATVVEDDVAWALTVRGFPTSVIHERVEQSLMAVDIADLRKRAPQTLSGGQRQRLAIAGVLALRPKCIIADEATSMLDPLSRQEIVALLHQLHQAYGLTIIHVTHLLDEIALAQRVVVMEQGEVVVQGTPTDLFSDLPRLQALKLSIPEPIELAARLRKAGMPIARDAITLEAIAREYACISDERKASPLPYKKGPAQ